MAEGDVVNVGTEAWNQADAYTKLKVLRPLVLCDKYERIAIYGVEEIEQDLELPPQQLILKRINGLFRLKDEMKILMGNVSFAISKKDRNKFESLRERLKIVEEMMDEVSYEVSSVDGQIKTMINDYWFSVILTELQELKESINVPINHAGLIFRQDDSVDLDEWMLEVARGG